jgi:phosphomannomutase/phosphoglucomutase
MNGVDTIEMGVMPTPCLQFNIKALHAKMGVTVTASHNPNEYNGIKFTGAEGLEISREEEKFIEEAVHFRRFPEITWNRMGSIREDTAGIARYQDSIRKNADFNLIRKVGLKVVLDPGNGTSAASSPLLLREATGSLITLNSNPDGYFPGRPSEPTEANLAQLRKAVPDFQADLGIAHDGDSDRIAFIDERGRYVPGEVALALFAKYVLKHHPGGTVATSVTSSNCVEDVVREMGGKIVITRSGSLPVAIGVREHHAVFGGEENGHFYWPEHQNAPDGPMSSLKILEVLANEHRPLSALVEELPKYSVMKTKTELPPGLRAPVVERVLEALKPDATRLVTMDGVKAYWEDGWLLVRPSGTEPICRVFAESRSAPRAQELMERGVGLVQQFVKELQQA